MPFANITINPTVDTDAYAAGDVVFNPTSIELPAKKCRLLGVTAYDKGSTPGSADTDSIALFFFRNNEADLGTLNATADISVANFESNQLLGTCKLTCEHDALNAELDNVKFLFGHNTATAIGATDSTNLNVVLEGSTKSGVGNTCYVAGVQFAGSSDFVAATDLKIVLSLEY
tara:strand:+ start:728 stop:1246 length:519 start_codon:yes stop_codon:yes gene_type:complete